VQHDYHHIVVTHKNAIQKGKLVLTFQWKVAESGYEWLVRGDHKDVLQPIGMYKRMIPHANPRWAKYGGMMPEVKTRLIAPLEESTSLFLTFAHATPTRAGIKTFADSYGLLSHAFYAPDEVWTDVTFNDWVENILWFRLAVSLWELIRNRDMEGLASYIRWNACSEVWIDTFEASCDSESPSVRTPKSVFPYLDLDVHVHPGKDELLPVLHIQGELVPGSCIPGDLVHPAQAFLLELTNQFLTETVSPRMVRVPSLERTALRFQPGSLLSALWLQFSLAMTGDQGYQQCPNCQVYFELSPNIARSDKLFCSNACRTRAYRRRIDQAKRLYAEGVTLEDIAQKLETDRATVRGWVMRSRKRKTSTPHILSS
jgi:transposase-like protein